MAGYYDSRLGQALSLMGNTRMVNPFEGVSSAFANIANLGFKAQEAERQQSLDTQNKQLFEMNMQRLQREKQQTDLKDIYNRYGQYKSTTPQNIAEGIPQEPVGNIPASELANISMTPEQYENATRFYRQDEQTRALNLANAEQAQKINALKLAQAQTEQAENTLPISQSPYASIAKQFKVPDNTTVGQFKEAYNFISKERDYTTEQNWKSKSYALQQQALAKQAKASNIPEWAYKIQQNQLATGYLDNSISTLGTVENALSKANKDRTEEEKKQIRYLGSIGVVKGRSVDKELYSKKVYDSFIRGGGTETPVYQEAQANAKVIYAANHARLKELSKNKGKLAGTELQEYNQLSESMREGLTGITRKILFGLEDKASDGYDLDSITSDIRFTTPPIKANGKAGYNGTGSPQTLNPMPSRNTAVNPSEVINYMEGRR